MRRWGACAPEAPRRFEEAEEGTSNGAGRKKSGRRVHNLATIFRRLNKEHFGNEVDAHIVWGRRGPAGRGTRRSIQWGSYSAPERMIRIHPALDQAWVPEYFVAYIIFHEMLHHVLGWSCSNGRCEFHPPAFREREQAYPGYRRALAWEKAQIDRVLRAKGSGR